MPSLLSVFSHSEQVSQEVAAPCQPPPPTPQQGSVIMLSALITFPAPRISVSITQNNVTKGTANVLPDLGSLADILSINLARNLGLDPYDIPEDVNFLTAANGQPIAVHSETIFIMALCPK